MPKTPSVILKNMLAREGYELLDIYRFKKGDYVRVRKQGSTRVAIVRLEKHVDELAGENDIEEAVKHIVSEARKAIEEGSKGSS